MDLLTHSANKRWLRVAALCGLTYPVIGVTFALPASSPAARGWRLAAWLASAAVFAAHLWYEHSRLRDPPARAAVRVAAAVALGAFALAVWINVHAHWVAAPHQSPLAPLALVLFPLVAGLPAFVAALVLLSLLARMRR